MKWPIPLLLGALLASCGGGAASDQGGSGNPAPNATSLSQDSAPVGSAGFTLTITGTNFIANSVVKWNGSARTTTFLGGTQLSIAVSGSDLSLAAAAQVSVSNPAPGGGNSGSLTFSITPRIANGIALPGGDGDSALSSAIDLAPVSAQAGDLQGSILMTRLELRFAKSATVAQVNGALANLAAGIVSMSKGLPALTIGIPKQGSIADLQTLIAKLESSPGILLATLARVAKADSIFNGGTPAAFQQIRHLLAARFPAVWNVARTDVFGDPGHPAPQLCPLSPLPVLIHDFFEASPPANFDSSFPPYDPPIAPTQVITAAEHGYLDAIILGANGIGADPFPFSGCMDLHLVQAAAFYSGNQTIDFLAFSMPATDKFIVSASLGFGGSSCELDDCQTPTDEITTPLERASAALHWKEKTRALWPNFLMVVAAGNDRDGDGAKIWPGTEDSRFQSAQTIAQLTDNTFQFVLDDRQWTPSATFLDEGFKTLKPSATEQANLVQSIDDVGLADADATEDNIIVVGSTVSPDPAAILTQHIVPGTLAESTFSNSGPDILAVGESVFAAGNDGTSFATPQVSGLAAFLWMISPDLRDQPVAVTKRAIVTNANNHFLDAYATVLSLDAGGVLPTAQSAPIRKALLDVNGDGKFDEADLGIFLSHLQDSNGNPVTPTAPDYSRYDLNGDGFTGGSSTERFDLDRVGSIQYGATSYSTVSQQIEQKTVNFDETAVNDLQILCYYAYSGMYSGDVAARAQLMSGCAGVSVQIQPSSVSLAQGATRQFSATVQGSNDPRVVWSLAESSNTITDAGLFTAGGTGGTFKVRATSVADPRAFAEATVSVSNCNLGPLNFLHYAVADQSGGAVSDFLTDTGTLTDSHRTADTFESINLSYGVIEAESQDTNIANALSSSASALGDFSDTLLINAADPALQGTAFIFSMSVRVDAVLQISGDQAEAQWLADLSADGGVSTPFTGVLSSLAIETRGDLTGGTYSASGSGVFGQNFSFEVTFNAFEHYPCGMHTCPSTASGTGTGHAVANLHWQGFTVKDQQGNAVPFTSCSATGTDWTSAK
jgi:hypothetical protein